MIADVFQVIERNHISQIGRVAVAGKNVDLRPSGVAGRVIKIVADDGIPRIVQCLRFFKPSNSAEDARDTNASVVSYLRRLAKSPPRSPRSYVHSEQPSHGFSPGWNQK